MCLKPNLALNLSGKHWITKQSKSASAWHGLIYSAYAAPALEMMLQLQVTTQSKEQHSLLQHLKWWDTKVAALAAASFHVLLVPKCGHVGHITAMVLMCLWFHWTWLQGGVGMLTGATLSHVGLGTLVGEIPTKFTLWNNFLQWAWKTLVPTLHCGLEAPFWFCRNKMKVFLVSDFCG